jgi:hypothetical protein
LIDAQKYIALRDNALKYSIDLQAILADRLKIQKEFSAEEQKIIDEANAYFAAQVKKQKEIQESEKPDFAGLAKDEVDMVKEGQDQILTVLETSSLEKETALREEYNKGLISEKQYQDKLAKIKKDAAKEAILFQIQAGEAQLKYLEAAGQAGTKAYDDIKHAVEGLKNAYANLGDTAAEKLKKLGDSLSLVNEYTQKLGSLLVQAAEIGYNKQRNALQALEDAQQKHYEKEVDRINQTVISETDKANQLKILEAQRLAQKEANDRKERQLETQKARYAKAANIANIITSGALAVVKALGEGGPILAAVVGALSAAELAIAIATPVPQYRHGTKDHIGGLALVGDGGKKEYAVTPEGELFETPDKPTIMDLPKHTVVYPDANEFRKAALSGLHSRYPAYDVKLINNYEYMEKKMEQNTKEIRALRMEIRNKRENHYQVILLMD